MTALAWLALLATGGVTLAAWLRLRAIRLPSVAKPGSVTLILPLTGAAPGLEALFAALAAQTLAPRRLVAVVESAGDPAFARVTALAPTLPFPVETRIAGTVAWRGQKSTNLIAGLAAIDDADEAVVLLDADIRPQRWWLSALASPVFDDTHDLVSGHRWQLLGGRGPLGHLVAWNDRNAAAMRLPTRWGLVWGGSVGLSRRALVALDLPALLDRALVDDHLIGAAARAAGLRLLVRGALTVPTPAEGGDRAQVAFYRRQLAVLRISRPWLWLAVTGAAHLSALGWLVAIVVAPPLAVALSATGIARALLHRAIGARVGIVDPVRGTLAQCLVGAVPPLGDGLVAALGWWNLRPRRLRWRHVTYEVRGAADVRVLTRASHA